MHLSPMTPARRLWLIELTCVIGLLLLAAALRLYRLSDYPAGYHNDEAAVAHLIEEAMRGRLVVFFPEETGTEPLYMYLSAPLGWMLGASAFTFRLSSAFLFLLSLCAVWALARRLFGRLVAGVALAAMGVSWWGLLLGRITSHVVTVAPMLALAVYLFWRALHCPRSTLHPPRSTLHLALAGVFFALAFNSYTAARVVPILILAYGMYLVLVQREVIRQRWRGTLIMAAITFILSAPLAYYLLTHPAAKQLSYSGFDVDQPVTDLLSGDPRLALETTLQTLGMFGFASDPLPYYNLPGRSLFEPVGTVLFWMGVAIAVWHWREPRYGLVLIGWLITLAPGMLSQPAPNYARTVGAMAFAFIFPGLTVELMWQRARAKWGHGVRRIAVAVTVGLLMGNVIWTVHDFFVVWPRHPETRWWMQTGLKEVADALNVAPHRGPVAICVSSHLIDERAEWWRPAWWIYHYLSPRTEADARWYDCAESVVIPAGDARFAFPDVTSLEQLDSLAVGRWMRAAPTREETRTGQSLIISTDPMVAWSSQVSELASEASVAWTPEADLARPLPVDFGHALQLTAYEVQGRAAPGAVITVTTYWQVMAPPEPRLALFTHVLTGTRIVAQNDRLAITSQSLQPGDVFLQRHIIELPHDIERGWYQLSVGLYSQDTRVRLPVYKGAQPVADRVFLQPLRVWRSR